MARTPPPTRTSGPAFKPAPANTMASTPAKPRPGRVPAPEPLPRPPSIVVQRMTRRMAALTEGELRGLLAWLCEHDWQREAVEQAEGADFQPLGLFSMKHARGDRVAITAAYLVRVRRRSDSPTRPDRVFIAAIYLGDDLRTLRVHIRPGEKIPEHNRLAVIRFAADPEAEAHPAPAGPGVKARTAVRRRALARASR